MLPFLPAIAEEKAPTLFNSSEESKSDEKNMRSMSWNSPKPKDEKTEEVEETTDTDEEEIDEDGEKVSEEELTPEEKLWEKYKKLAEGADTDAEDKNGEDDEISEEDEEALLEEEKIIQETIGLKSIIEDYKNSQENKGTMNSRSFGNVD